MRPVPNPPAPIHPDAPSVTPITTVSAPAPQPRRVVAFTVIALAGASLLSVPFALRLLPGEAIGLVVPLAQLVPLLAVLLVRDRRAARRRDDLALTVPSRSRLLLAGCAALAAFVLVPLVRLAIGAVMGLAPLQPVEHLAAVALAVPVVLVMQCVFAVGEEVAWRGWLAQRSERWGLWPSSLLIGGLWALWHVPVVLALGLDPREAVSYLLLILAVAPLLSALARSGGCVWPAVLGHGPLNSVRVAIDQNLTGPAAHRSDLSFWVIEACGWALWLVAAGIVHRRLGSARASVHRARSGVGPLH